MKLAERWQNMQQTVKAMHITLRRGLAPLSRKGDPGRPSIFRGYPVLRRDDDGRVLCTACGKCADECPTRCISAEPFTIDGERCIYCGICAAICPENAIEISDTIAPVAKAAP
jgi:formate hydrogenlyase subunit 6/NADH:ubiquinone oxidoreductase subunit I